MHTLAVASLVTLVIAAAGLVAAVAFGGPVRLPPMQAASDPFSSVDFSDLPALERFTARDGTQLSYRAYRHSGRGSQSSVVLVHGSSSRSDRMHAMARGLAERGFDVYAPDMRGHGESGAKGQISYIGQLEDDLEDFARAKVPGRRVLVGFSAGGGFALRFAADKRRGLFDGYVLLSPFLSHRASTYRRHGGGWASVGLPRIFVLIALNRAGVSGLNYLPVTSYALTPAAAKILTPGYSYALAMNFRPNNNYKRDIANASQPMEVLVGDNDEQFYPDRFSAEFESGGRPLQVSIVPGTGHMDLTLAPVAIESVAQAVARVSREVTP